MWIRVGSLHFFGNQVAPYAGIELQGIFEKEVSNSSGDGINDRWLITNGNCIRNASVHVYNRYGSLVYENKDYKNDWEGTYKGKPVPDGTYYFVIEYKLLDGRDVFIKGNLTILR